MRETAIQGHSRSSVPGLSDFLVLPVCICLSSFTLGGHFISAVKTSIF